MCTGVVSLEAPPLLLPGYTVAEHRGSGVWHPDPGSLTLHLSATQRSERESWAHAGLALLEETRELPAANLNVCLYLVSHPHDVPYLWDSPRAHVRRMTYTFWGTVVKNTDGTLCVPQMFMDERWRYRYVPLKEPKKRPFYWYGKDPAVLFKE